MKTIFKSISLAVLFVGIGSTAFAQLGAQRTVDVTARILKQITLDHTNVNFGAIAAGGGATYLDPRGANSTNVGFVSVAGRLIIDATPDEDIRVEFPSYVVLLENSVPSTDDSLSFIPQISVAWGDVAIGDAAQATSLLANNTTAAGVPSVPTAASGTGRGPFIIVTTEPSATDEVTLFIGGEIWQADGNANTAVQTGQQTGTYVGDMLFNVLYAN